METKETAMAKKLILATAALCLAAVSASAQDKSKPKKDEGPQDSVLKEVDKRMKAQGEELLRAVENLLDARLGKPERSPDRREAAPRAGQEERKGDGRAPVLKEVDRRLRAQKEEVLKGVERLLEARLGKGPKSEPGRSRDRLPPGLEMQRRHLPPGLQGRRMEKDGHNRKSKGEKHDDRGKKKGGKDHDRGD
jgi:hypothetical protein